MKKIFNSRDEAEKFLDELQDQDKFVFSALQMDDSKYEIQWIEHKQYTATDGKTFPDEVWFTKEGDMVLIQDLEAEHARNILRMLLRKKRELTEAISDMISKKIQNEEFFDGIDDNDDQPRVLH